MGGIYIPNMKKPKRCDDCWALDDKYDYPMCLITQEQRGYNFNTMTQIMDKCPLIDIVTCEECVHCIKGEGMPFCDIWLREVEADIFCSYGERRE